LADIVEKVEIGITAFIGSACVEAAPDDIYSIAQRHMARADHMRAWSRSLEAMVRAEAERLIAEHGNKAAEIARHEARKARDQHKHRVARQYALVAAYITEQSKSV